MDSSIRITGILEKNGVIHKNSLVPLASVQHIRITLLGLINPET